MDEIKKIIASNLIKEYPQADVIIRHLIDHQADYQLSNNTMIYFGFPKFVGYDDNNYEPDLLLVSPIHGIIVIKFLNTKDSLTSNSIEDITEELYSLLFSKLNESKLLRENRGKIKIPLNSYVFLENTTIISDYVLSSLEHIEEILTSLRLEVALSDELMFETHSILEGTKALSSGNKRIVRENDNSSKAYIISQLENEIKTFDYNQLQSAVTILDGPQRIRGLAGSGKTVVLAMKAAQIHLNEPEKLILFTFYTKSLYQQIKDLITKFYRHYKKTDPDWNNIQIKHAWGGQGLDGVYYNSCISNSIQTIAYKEAMQYSTNPFDYVCQRAVESGRLKEKYDYVLIDEAQDLPTYFFRLIYAITKFNPNIKSEKNIIWGYDDLQNIFNVKTKTPRELFGHDSEGLDFIDLERAQTLIPAYLKNDIVLHKCYRNPRSVLLVAHSLGFGLYNSDKTLPVQILENKEHWEDLGYEVQNHEIIEGHEIVVNRPETNSPLSIKKFMSEKDDLIQYYEAKNLIDEVAWIVNSIFEILSDGLHPEDILVISLDDRNAKVYFNAITEELMKESIYTNNLLLNPYTSVDFTRKDHVTLSTVHRAKGNEAAVVFVVGMDALYNYRQSISARNKIFTAFTRTKCCLKISGFGENASFFFKEIDATLNDYPTLKFIQPSLDDVATIQRDLNDKNKKLREIKQELEQKMHQENLSSDDIIDLLNDLKSNSKI